MQLPFEQIILLPLLLSALARKDAAGQLPQGLLTATALRLLPTLTRLLPTAHELDEAAPPTTTGLQHCQGLQYATMVRLARASSHVGPCNVMGPGMRLHVHAHCMRPAVHACAYMYHWRGLRRLPWQTWPAAGTPGACCTRTARSACSTSAAAFSRG